jgi:glycosyltransferase involved in cell wall biosynthesis
MLTSKYKKYCLYIFLLSKKGDYGPKEHVRQIFKNINQIHLVGISSLSNKDINCESDLFSINLENIKGTILKTMIFQIFAVLCLLKIVKKEKKPLIVLLRQSLGLFLPVIIGRIMGIPVVMEVNGVLHQDLLDRKRGKLLQFFNKVTEYITIRLCNKIIVVHDNLKIILKSLYSLPDGIFKTIENGTDVREWINPIDARKRDGIYDDNFRFGYLGSLAYREGVDLILNIATKMKKENVQFIIVGGTNDEVNNLKLIIRQKRLYGKIAIYSYMPRDDALRIMETCDAFIHLRRKVCIKGTDSQGSPLKMLDYLNIGRPVVVSNISAYKYIKEKKFGLLVDIDQEKDIIRGIKEVMKDKEKWLRKARNANIFIREEKSWQKTAAKIEYELKKLLI